MRDFNRLKGDVFGGITAAIVALPLSLAFGVASGLGAAAGLYGAMVLGFIAALLGGTPTQISGPTGPITVVVAAAFVSLNHDVHLLVGVFLLAAVFQLSFGLLNLGRYIKYIPYPVISGFMSGIGALIVIIQLNPLLGHPSESSAVSALVSLPGQLLQVNPHALLIGGLALLIMLLTPKRINAVVPAPLLALLCLTPLAAYAQLEVLTIGEIPTTWPQLIRPDFSWSLLQEMTMLGLTVALLASIDTLLTSVVADSITQTRHNAKRELIGQGIGNLLCAGIGAMPGAGATMRTVVNVKSGGTTRLSGITHALVLVLILLFFAPFAAQIPLPVLAGILIKVGMDILDYRFLRNVRQSPRSDALVMGLVFFTTVLVDLMVAVGLGIVAASLLIVYKITRNTTVSVQTVDPTVERINADEKISRVKINGALFFGSTHVFESGVDSIEGIDALIIDLLDSPFIDVTAIFMLKDSIARLQKRKVRVLLVLSDAHRAMLLKMNKTGVFNAVQFFNNLADAYAAGKR